MTGDPFAKEDIVEGMNKRREGDFITAASAAYLNNALQLTASSLRYAAAFGSR